MKHPANAVLVALLFALLSGAAQAQGVTGHKLGDTLPGETTAEAPYTSDDSILVVRDHDIDRIPGDRVLSRINGTTTVSSNPALKALAGVPGMRVLQTGFTTAGDGGAGIFDWATSSCAHADDGAEVQPTGVSGCWRLDLAFQNYTLRLRQFGAAEDGATDDRAKLDLAAAALNRAGGGTIKLGPKQYLIDSNLDLTGYKNITIEGNIATYGSDSAPGASTNYLARPYTLVSNPAITINLGIHDAIRGVNFARKGMTAPTTHHQLQAEINNFAGTAITCTGKFDNTVEYSTFVGFAVPISAGCDRLTLDHVRYDTANGAGINGTYCGDACRWRDVESWPLLHATSNDMMEMTVVGAANNGAGLIRITVSSAPVEALVTGDKLTVGNVGGVPNAVGRWTITVISPTVFDLQGSTFAGTFTSGGQATWKPIRAGSALTLNNGIYFLDGYENYGNDVGADVTGTGPTNTYAYFFGSAWIDGFIGGIANIPDPTPIGLRISGDYAAEVNYQGTILSSGTGISMNAANATLNLTDSKIAASYGDAAGYPISLAAGTIYGSGVKAIAVVGNHGMYIGHLATSVNFVNSVFGPGQGYAYEVGYDLCNKIASNGVIGPCVWTPTLAFGGSSAGITYDAATYGTYTQTVSTGAGHVKGEVKLTSQGGAHGAATIGNLPMTEGPHLPATCLIGFHSGLTGITTWENFVIPGTSIVSLGSTGGRYDDSNFSNTADLFFDCDAVAP